MKSCIHVKNLINVSILFFIFNELKEKPDTFYINDNIVLLTSQLYFLSLVVSLDEDHFMIYSFICSFVVGFYLMMDFIVFIFIFIQRLQNNNLIIYIIFFIHPRYVCWWFDSCVRLPSWVLWVSFTTPSFE